MKRTWLSAALLPVALVATGALAGPSRADTVPTAPVALSSYQQVVSDPVTNDFDSVSFTTVDCPKGTRVIGGGVVIAGSSFSEAVSGSYPIAPRTWSVTVYNSSQTNGSFRAYAICAAGVLQYQVVRTDVDAPIEAQSSVSTACPAGKVPLGGGGEIYWGSQQRNSLNSSVPSSNGWRVDVNNEESTAWTASAYAVCAKKPAGYRVRIGPAKTVPTATQGYANVTCLSGTVAFSGGALSNSTDLDVKLNSLFPTGNTGFRAYENNNSLSSTTLTTEAICGAVT